MVNKLNALSQALEGDLHWDETLRTLYATDASAYQELPLAVAIPRTSEDIRRLIHFARDNGTSLIPRAAGTSLAGQVVGQGIVVDVSKHFTQILEINAPKGWARVQPGVIRNELNRDLAPHGKLFGPETSTQNRAMLGGMLGNNSCGSNSIVYGSTREHLVAAKGFLSDGSEVTFQDLTPEAFQAKCDGPADSLETQVYRHVRDALADPENRAEITAKFPKASIPRRNTGYALDLLMDAAPLDATSQKPFNFCQLIAGSEGTLFFATEITVRILDLPPAHNVLLCAHFETVDEALQANLIAIQHAPYGCELMDRYILDCTKGNRAHEANRFFLQGDPGALLIVEMRADSERDAVAKAQAVADAIKATGHGYHFPIVTDSDANRVWDLRKAGLGLLSNIPGDAKPVPVVEDTAVDVQDLPEYIARFNQLLKERYQLECVHYAHAGSGEIHLRPIINLKTERGNRLFRQVAQDIAALVKEYRGSLSGEHGDGRLRGEFLESMIGSRNYALLRSFKQTWDPKSIFNPNKIVDTPPMNASLRYRPGQQTRELKTYLDFSATQGLQRAAELCNGSGDCRKTHLSGGVMCPSYMATRDEKDSTRARANILRNVLTDSTATNPLDSDAIKDVMHLCLSCKGCKAECPSSVDVGKMKAEFLQQYYDANGTPLRARLIGAFAKASRLASIAPSLWNRVFSSPLLSRWAKKASGFAPERSLPLLHETTLENWRKRHSPHPNAGKVGKVLLFCDEFTNYNDTPIGIKTIELLERLGYSVAIPEHHESARASLSQGLLKRARQIANQNIRLLQDTVSEATPLLGIEPSAILGFRDEYLDLAAPKLKDAARTLAKNTLLVEEFLIREHEAGRLDVSQFHGESKTIKLHGHCHQKALAGVNATIRALSLPKRYQAHLIPSGCCGMAGAFGYQAETYEVSMQIGELVLFPTVRKQPQEILIAAPGTSCRHQIKDGTGKIALHPMEILHEALRET